MNVYFQWDAPDVQWTYPMHLPEFAGLLADFGCHKTDKSKADVSFRDYRFLDPSVCPAGKTASPPDGPTIVFVRQDCSWPPQFIQRWTLNDNVIGFVLPILAPNAESSICASVYGNAAIITKPMFALTAMLWHELPRYPCYLDLPEKKDWDVCFIGTMHHRGNAFIKKHRAILRKEWHQLDGFLSVAVFNADVGIGYVIKWTQAWNVISRSKVAVCPWGICEISWRDYEAVLGGCIIVKPKQPFIDVTCSPWTDQNVVYCETDYSDLGDRVSEAIQLYEARKDVLLELRRHMTSPGLPVLAGRAAEILNSFVEKS